jgi:anti-anti-sigma regulatory factor
MPSHIYPVVVAYRLGASANESLGTVQINSVALDAPRARANALLIAEHWLRLRHGKDAAKIIPDRTKCGSSDGQVNGPHLIIISDSDIVQAIGFPKRIDSDPGERLGEVLAGLDPSTVHAVLFSCAELTYINTIGLTSIAAHVKRLRLHLFQVPETVFKVFEIVGLSRYLTLLPGLEEALVAIPPRAIR